MCVYINISSSVPPLCNCYSFFCWGFRISAVTENAAVLIHFGGFLLIKAVLASALFAAASAAAAEASAVQSTRGADKRHCGLSHHFVSVFVSPPPLLLPLTRDFVSLYLHWGKPVGPHTHTHTLVFLYMRPVRQNIKVRTFASALVVKLSTINSYACVIVCLVYFEGGVSVMAGCVWGGLLCVPTGFPLY